MANSDKFKILVFSKTAGYRHESIPAGIRAIQGLGEKTGGFNVDASEDAALITATNLAQYAVVVFLQTSGDDLLNEQQLASLQSYVRSGNGFVGVHCAAAGLPNTPWYGELVGAHFTDHPKPQHGKLNVENKGHSIVSGLPEEWPWFDEWYNFASNPRQKVNVLLSVNEKEYEGGTMGEDHPLAWCREFEGGRSFYTSLGHFDEAYDDAMFLALLLNGILWAAGKA
ncbi:glycosyl hydrolase [Hyaloscypha variabilis F]|uniref:Glycosyl hydrolase n=1 Tax=Hyaloscypha variabilis (strain UAMH 11265 / GT02V1 / F) TaxID=1149755 RepID=A0A2J6QVK1_HYAVF|nr:glycosyl hydrolase [Hyaloscypha variabilis F]